MRIEIIAVGRLKESYWQAAVVEYVKRLKPYVKLHITELADIDPSKCDGEAAAMNVEAANILKLVERSDFLVALALQGKQLTSEQFAATLDEHQVRGTGRIVFAIGSSCGLADAIYARANSTLSLGRITLPHNIARIVLVEQIYRAFKIIRNEPYHK